jgi:hypothetical protein
LTKLEHALAHAARGFKVFPITPGKKSPPLLTGWPQRATSDPDTIRQYWAPYPDANIGIHCEGMIVIDVDVKKGGDESLQKLEVLYGLPDTLVARTPSGGRHLFYAGSGASNTVGKVADGIDVRTAGGYVVGAGSSVALGDYTWDADRGIAPAPEWLVLKLGTAVPKTSTSTAVDDAPDALVENARQWVVNQLPAIEGCGGDAQTFKVAAGLRDRGVSIEQATELMLMWNATCAPPWTPEEIGTKVRNAYNYGQNAPGAKVALPSDFTAAVSAIVDTKLAPRAQTLRLDEFAASTVSGPGYLIKGLLEKNSYAELFGQPGQGKTFVALDMAYHVAAGKPWMERNVHVGTVLYLAYEGTGGLVKRAQALRRKYGTDVVPLYITRAAYNLRERSGRQELAQVLADLPAKPSLIVIDTFARALMGGDENSAQDVGAFNSAIAELQAATGACVMIVHHSGKNKSAGARGSSALLGAIDTELEVDSNQVIASKQRDVEAGQPIGFNLKSIPVGMDEDGDIVTSCTVEPAVVVHATPLGKLKGNKKNGFDALCDLSPDNKPVYEESWREKCKGFLPKRSAAFWELKRDLQRAGHIEIDDNGMVTASPSATSCRCVSAAARRCC